MQVDNIKILKKGTHGSKLVSSTTIGKTTTTERMLHYAGVTRKIGG